MGLHATLVPRQIEPISCEDLYARFFSAGLAQHPNARQLETEEERAAWHFTLISDQLGIVSIEDAAGMATGTYASARIPGNSDSETVLNWAHHLWRISQQIDCEVVIGDPRMIRNLSSYLGRNASGLLRLVKQPLLRGLTDRSQDREIALHNAKNLYPTDDLTHALADLRQFRKSLFELSPVRIVSDSTFAEENPEHPSASPNRFRRQKAADFFKLLAVARPNAITEEILTELHESLFDRDAAVRMAVAETLGVLRHPISVSHLERLIESEDESDGVRNAARSAMEDCSDLFR